MSYEPTEWATGDTVTAAKLNKLERGIVNAQLPEVTADDNGDVLAVVEGAWAKAAPAGGVFNVTVTEETDDDNTYNIMNKTYNEILTAFSSGITVLVTLPDSGGISTVTACLDQGGMYIVCLQAVEYYSTRNASGYPQAG